MNKHTIALLERMIELKMSKTLDLEQFRLEEEELQTIRQELEDE